MVACCSSQDCCSQCPWPHGRPLSTYTSAGDSQTLIGKSGSISCGFTVPFSWALCTQDFLCPPRVCFPRGSQSFCKISSLGNVLWTFATVQELLWYNCSPVCRSYAQQLYSGTNGNLLQNDLCHKLHLWSLLQLEPLSPQQVTAGPCLCRRH